jgi:Tfp pilus assembly protein PilV
MTQTREREALLGQAGFALIEVMVSALIAVSMTGAVIGLLNSTSRAGAQERHRAQAFAIAQEDQARLRAMRISELGVASAPRTVPLNGTNYTVTSTSTFVTDKKGAPNCEAGTASADYVKLSTTVTWPSIGAGQPAVLESIVSPVSGSLDPTRGTLAVYVKNESNKPISGAGFSGSGSGNFSGSTDSTGCALFVAPAGNYTLTPSLGAEYVEYDGKAPPSETVTFTSGGTNTKELQYDKFGIINPVTFKYMVGSSSTFLTSTADSIIVYNARMKSGAALFGTPGGTRKASFEATPLYPFLGADTVYAGSCTGNNPGTGSAAAADVNVPAGGSIIPPVIQLPALELKVWTGKNSSNPENPFSNADVWIKDDNCASGGKPILRRYTTNSSGNLPDPGMPWSKYDLCADTLTGSATNGGRRQKIEDVEVKNLAGGTVVNFYLGGTGSSGASEGGQCS